MDKNQNLEIQLPPGFRFHPSDEELIVHYLRNKVTSCPLPASFIAEIELYKYNPWELPSKALFGEDEWYFFTPRDRKYPNGVRPNRAAGSGYWKATGTDKPILTSCGTKSIGLKKALVFYKGRPPKGYKTDWLMHEYRLHDSMNLHTRKIGSMRLDEWVLCRVRLKTNSTGSPWEDSNEHSNEPSTSDFQQVNGNSNQELVKNYVYNEFPMLPHILASKSAMPNSISMASSAGIGCNNDGVKAHASVHEDKLNLLGAQFLASSAESLLNPMKRKFVEENQLDIYAAPNKKLIEVGVDYYEKQILEANVSKGYNYNNFDQWTSMMQPQELKSLAFSGFI